MIALQDISIFSSDFCMQVFENLFDPIKNKEDLENIDNFLLIPYNEALADFKFKVDHLNILDEKIFFIYDSGNNLIGYTSIFSNRWTSFVNNEVEFGFFIKENERNKGYGTELIKQLESYIQRFMPNVDIVVLSPSFNNLRAANLYEKLGYNHEPNSLALSQSMFYMIKNIKEKSEIDKKGQIIGIKGTADRDSYLIGRVMKALSANEKVGIFDFSKGKNQKYQLIQAFSPKTQVFSFDSSEFKEVKAGVDLLMRNFLAYDTIILDGISYINFYGLSEEILFKWLRDQIPPHIDVIVSGYMLSAQMEGIMNIVIDLNITEVYD